MLEIYTFIEHIVQICSDIFKSFKNESHIHTPRNVLPFQINMVPLMLFFTHKLHVPALCVSYGLLMDSINIYRKTWFDGQ